MARGEGFLLTFWHMLNILNDRPMFRNSPSDFTEEECPHRQPVTGTTENWVSPLLQIPTYICPTLLHLLLRTVMAIAFPSNTWWNLCQNQDNPPLSSDCSTLKPEGQHHLPASPLKQISVLQLEQFMKAYFFLSTQAP